MAAYKPKTNLFSTENIVQITSLVFSIVLIGLAYSEIVRPKAEESQLQDKVRAAQQSDEAFVPQRTIWIIVKDYEQQICFTLMLWAAFIIGYKLSIVAREKKVLGEEFLDIDAGERIIPEEALIHSKQLEIRLSTQPSHADRLLPRVMMVALHRFHSTESIQDASQSIHELTESEGDQMDSELSLVRYIAWAIPSVGFIGTVRGIGEALTQADQAIKGDISGVTASLGLAFNSTLIALFLSIILMFFVHLLQTRQESLVHGIEEYCREKLVAVMKIPFKENNDMSMP